jgi:hypothetical protein
VPTEYNDEAIRLYLKSTRLLVIEFGAEYFVAAVVVWTACRCHAVQLCAQAL